MTPTLLAGWRSCTGERASASQIRALEVVDSLVRSHPAKGISRMGVFGELRGLGKAFWDRGELNGVGKFVRSAGDLAGLDNIANVGERLATLGAQVPDTKLLRHAAGSDILDAGQSVIEGMRLTTGIGEPEDGERFGQGWSRFNHAGDTLTSALPDDSWAGAGANAYVDQNLAQAGRTDSVALLDRGVQTVIAREAYQVKYHRDKIDDQSNFLSDLSYVTVAMGLVPGVGKAMKAATEVAAVNAALDMCSLELYQLSREANQNAAELEQAIGRYEGVAQTAKLKLTGTAGSPAAAPQDAAVCSEADADVDRLNPPVAVRLNADRRPTPPAATTPPE
jgi:hypothetical protein